VDELSKHSGEDQSELELHRPYVDEVTWTCTACDDGGTMRRVPELIDVWFDSGAMPVAQWGYPYYNQDLFKEQYPATYICEAVDQTRGWFYSLHAISSLLFESVAFQNCISLGHILDGEGQKMSKSKGNVVAPWDVLDEYGADAFRWYCYTAGPPGEARRFSVDLVGEVIRSFWLTLWNTYSFFVNLANVEQFDPGQAEMPVGERDPLDRWILAELHALVRHVTEAYESYDVPNATRPIEAFVDDLSKWYVRRSRRRFWKSDTASYLTLYECLVTIAKLLAPAMPFLSEALYRNLVGSADGNAPESVHLAMWPEYDEALIDEKLRTEMRVVRRLVSLGHAARNEAQIKVRQPVGEVAFSVPDADEAEIVRAYEEVIADELNVKEVSVLDEPGDVVTYALNPLPDALGPRFGKDFPKVQKELREGDAALTEARALALMAGKTVEVAYDGKQAEVGPEEVEVRQQPAEGYAVASDAVYLAGLKTELSEELLLEGLAREIVRRVQTLRREADFNIDDRVHLTFQAGDRLKAAIAAYRDYVMVETLADQMDDAKPAKDAQQGEYQIDGEKLKLGVQRLS
jgi:isoleucyl-tRNA synthetase